MNAEQLNAIKEREAKATPGPWILGPQAHGKSRYITKGTELGRNIANAHESDNAEFIAHAREDVLALVTEVEYLRALLRQRDRQLEGERKGSQRVQAENERLRAELQDIIVVATEEASCLSYESGYEDIMKIASDALK